MTDFENTIPRAEAAPAPAQPAPDALPKQPGGVPRTQAAEDSPSGDSLPDLPCDTCRDLIPLVQDGAASAVSGQLVAQHISHCPACRAFWQAGAPANRPDDRKVLGKIHQRLRLLVAAALIAGTLFGLWLMSFGFAGQYNLIIMPVVGAAGALLLRRRWYLTPLCVAALGFVWHAVIQDGAGPTWNAVIVVPLLYSVGYAVLCSLGAVAAKLFAYAFGKENAFARPIENIPFPETGKAQQRHAPRTKKKRVLAAMGAGAIVLLLAGVLSGYYGNPITRNMAASQATEYVDRMYPENDFEVSSMESEPCYITNVYFQSKSSEDTAFYVNINLGRVMFDSYEFDVAECENTWNRMIVQLASDVDAALSDAGISHRGYGLFHDNYLGSTGEGPVPAEGHPPLTLDMPYDKGNLPPVVLALDLNAPDDINDPQAEARNLAKKVKTAMDKEGIDLAAYVVTLYGVNNRVVCTTGLLSAADLA